MLYPNAQLEAGSLVQFVSLGGQRGKPGFGRQATSANVVVAAAVPIAALNQNQDRISALIVNTTANSCVLVFGQGITEGITLNQNQSLQIDSLLPWTGGVTAISAAGTTLEVVEVSIIS